MPDGSARNGRVIALADSTQVRKTSLRVGDDVIDHRPLGGKRREVHGHIISERPSNVTGEIVRFLVEFGHQRCWIEPRHLEYVPSNWRQLGACVDASRKAEVLDLEPPAAIPLPSYPKVSAIGIGVALAAVAVLMWVLP